MPLSPAAHAFTTRLAAQTGLNPRVIAGWVMAETSGHNTTNGPNNWLNVGSFDSGFQGGGANVWQNPITAADATAAFLSGRPVNGIRPPLGGGAPSIRGILSTVGRGPIAQVQAIQNSGWASSHYNNSLMADVRPFLGQPWPAGAAPGATAVPGAQVPKIGAVRVPFQTHTTQISPASIAGNFLAQESAVNPWELPTPGASKISTGPNPLLSTGVLPTKLQTQTITRNHQITLKAHGTLQKLAGQVPLQVPPASGVKPGSGSVMQSLFPAGTHVRVDRHDQGRDLQVAPGTHILAPGAGVVLRNATDPSGFGVSYPIVRFTSGPWAGMDVYFGHTRSLLRPGQHFAAGTPLSQTQNGSGPYVGNATGLPGWVEIGLAPGGVPGAFGQALPAGL